jgi:hypothetical protein
MASRIHRASGAFICATVSAALGLAATAQITHYLESRLDRFERCASAIAGKPVAFTDPWIGLTPDDCPATRDQFERKLSGRGVRVWNLASAIVIERDEPQKRRTWNRLAVTLNAVGVDFTGGRQLSTAEREAITAIVYRDARTSPVVARHTTADGDTASIDISLSLDVQELRRGTESVIGVWGQDRGIARLVYGEIHEGRFTLLWDSPLLKAFFWGLGYEDLDGDGVKEIIFRSDLSRDGRFYSVFDTAGRELSRQPNCEQDSLDLYDETTGVCAILCTTLRIEPPGPDGKRDLLVYGGSGQGVREPIRLHLTNGKFGAVSPRRPSPR